MTALDIAIETVKAHEGLRLKPYIDTVGKTTIGYGRNLDDVGISKSEAMLLLKTDLKVAYEAVRLAIYGFDTLSEMRQAVLIDMMFNLGSPRFKQFKKMIQALEDNDYSRASFEMLDSKWAVQVGNRANYLAEKMKQGI